MIFHEQAHVSQLMLRVFHVCGVGSHYHGMGTPPKNFKFDEERVVFINISNGCPCYLRKIDLLVLPERKPRRGLGYCLSQLVGWQLELGKRMGFVDGMNMWLTLEKVGNHVNYGEDHL